MQYHRNNLWIFKDPTETPERNGKHFRGLLCRSLWIGLGYIKVDWSDAVVQRFHDEAYTLIHLVEYMHEQEAQEVIGFEWTGLTDYEIANQLAIDSPKLRVLARMTGNVTIVLDEKMLVWAEYLIEILLITKFLKALDIPTIAYHAQLPVK